MPLVPLVVGPVSAASARVWLTSAQATLRTVRSRPELGVPEAVLGRFQAYVDEWTAIADGEQFLWRGTADPAMFRSVAAHWARLVNLAREDPEATGISVAPPEGEAFFVALATGMADVLAAIDDDDEAFADKFDEVVPEFTDGRRRPDGPPARSRVLLVDDNPDIRLLLRIGLETSGAFEIMGEASNGQEAIDAMDEGCPDAVVLDLSMPVMDGQTALPLLKQRCPRVRVLVFSADDAPEVRREMADKGAFAFLRKDAPIRDIAAALRGG